MLKRFTWLEGILCLSCWIVVAGLEAQETPSPVAPTRLYVLDDIKVKDGDTIQADIHLGFDVVLNDQSIRCSDYDAWESSKRRRSVNVTDEEVEKGRLATVYLQELLGSSKVFLQESGQKKSRDVYGRVLGKLHVQKQNQRYLERVSTLMKAGGHLREEE